MAILHYRVVPADCSWLVSCEDVPIQAFDDENGALGAAIALIEAAGKHGDTPSLFAGCSKPNARTSRTELVSAAHA